MPKIEATEDIDYDRRRFFGAAAATFAVAQLGLTTSAKAQETIPGPQAMSSTRSQEETSLASTSNWSNSTSVPWRSAKGMACLVN